MLFGTSSAVVFVRRKNALPCIRPKSPIFRVLSFFFHAQVASGFGTS